MVESYIVVNKNISINRVYKRSWFITSALDGSLMPGFNQELGAHKNNWQTLAAISGSRRYKKIMHVTKRK